MGLYNNVRTPTHPSPSFFTFATPPDLTMNAELNVTHSFSHLPIPFVQRSAESDPNSSSIPFLSTVIEQDVT